LQSLPEEPRLADAPDFVAPRDDSLFAVLPYQLAQCVNELGLQLLESLVVRAEVELRRGSGLTRQPATPAIPIARRNNGGSSRGIPVGRSDLALRRTMRGPPRDSTVRNRAILPHVTIHCF
jgi:hypothetical protein